MATVKPLEKELQTYNQNLHNLLADEGKYVVIYGENIDGIFESYADALKSGYEKFGVVPFLVKKISATEQVSYFTRDLGTPCHT